MTKLLTNTYAYSRNVTVSLVHIGCTGVRTKVVKNPAMISLDSNAEDSGSLLYRTNNILTLLCQGL